MAPIARLPMTGDVSPRFDLLPGTLDFLVLQTLRWGPRHGYGIAQTIRTTSNDVLRVETGSLYPALHRLERKKWIAAQWETSENRQRVRVYRLTASGKRRLTLERTRWSSLAETVGRLMRAPLVGEA